MYLSLGQLVSESTDRGQLSCHHLNVQCYFTECQLTTNNN